MTNTKTSAVVAETILQQLGGGQFLAMTGAKNLVYDERSLTMKLGRNPGRVNWLRITLDASDTYTLEFLARDASVMVERSGVYFDSLRAHIETHTGLLTRL